MKPADPRILTINVGLEHTTVGKAVQRFEASLPNNRQKLRAARSSLRKLLLVKMRPRCLLA
jgi:hypothetical protein